MAVDRPLRGGIMLPEIEFSSRLLIPIALLFAIANGVMAQDTSPESRRENANAKKVWPNWMGPNHDGISIESGWSKDWPTDGLPVLWKKELGTGFSSFSVVDGFVWSMGHRDGQETVWCLDGSSGEEIWTHSYQAKLNPNLYEGGPGSTPTIHAGMVFTLSVDGRVIGFRSETGKVAWEVDLQKELDVGMHEWGFNSSPYILDNQLLLECGRVVSIDWKTGRKLWQSAKHQAGYGSVRAFPFKGEMLLASLDCEGLRISRAEDGSEVALAAWRSPFRTNSTTPIVSGDHIFVSTGYNVGSVLFRLAADGLKQQYAHRKMRNHFNNSILYDGHLYGFDGNSNLGRVVRLICMDFETGLVKWKQTGLGCGSLTIVDGHLLILSDEGDLVLAKATSDAFTEVSRSPFLKGRCWTAPVLVNGRIYGRNSDGHAVCVRVPK
jgi:outer membrane protein assembly factor BamB